MTAGFQRSTRIQGWHLALIIGMFLVFGFLTNRAGQIEHGSARTTFPIVAFEVAGSGDRAEQILSDAAASLAATDFDLSEARAMVETSVRTSLWWDYGFLVGFSLLIFASAHALGHRLSPGLWEQLGVTVGWSGLLAGLLDAIETAALFQVLTDTALDLWARVAAVASWGKWALVAVAISYSVAGLTRLATWRFKLVARNS